MAATQEKVVEVTFQGCMRRLTRAQVAKAPSSLLGKLFLSYRGDVEGVDAVIIPSEGTAPGVAVWRDGSQALFQVCMNCYTSSGSEGALQDQPYVDIASLRKALDFFDVPSSLWPTELRLAIKALQLKEDRRKVAKRLLHDCVQIIDEKWSDQDLDHYSNMKHGGLLKCKFTFYWQTIFSDDGGPLAVKRLRVMKAGSHMHTEDCYGIHEDTYLSVELQQDLSEIGYHHHMHVMFTNLARPLAMDGCPVPAWGMTLSFA